VIEMSPCEFAGCGGTVTEGYCDECGRAPFVAPARVTGPLGWGEQAYTEARSPSAPAAPPPPSPSPPPPPPRLTPGASPLALRPVDPASACQFAGCHGTVVEGYCDECGRAPLLPYALAVPPPMAPEALADANGQDGDWYPAAVPRLRPSSARTVSSGRRAGRRGSFGIKSRGSGGRRRLGQGLINVPAVPEGDPLAAVMPVAEVPEDDRFCSNCNHPVGRSRGDQPGRPEGFCRQCRTRFSFTPRLGPGDLVGEQYQVIGALAHGGLGWIHLARDRAVSDRWVVLKGLLDTASEEAAMAAVAERRFLAALDHPNIVRIHNFVAHQDAGYIVMEYVGGQSLKAILKARRDARGGINPLPVDQAIAYTLGVLPALGYLHAQGMLYCDMKPDNVMLSGDSLKIIDVGGVRRIDDEEATIYGTIGYQAPEVADAGPSVASDLYTVGRMLAVLLLDFRGYQTTYANSLPGPNEHPVLAQRESLHRFLLKATATDPLDRFESAEEMAEQLLGVLREETAARGEAYPAVSTVFEPGGVVGSGAHDEVGPDWRLLPPPKVDPVDPGVGVVVGVADSDPAAVVANLTSALSSDAVPATPETLLRLARAHLHVGSPEAAAATLDHLGDERDWRLWWHRGLTALAQERAVEAIDWLDPVYSDLPGEVPPKLAVALAHELAGHLGRSAHLYDVASRTDPAYVFGAFGLARVRVALGDREGAVAALERVPRASSAHITARIAVVRALASPAGSRAGPPSPDQLALASTILDELWLTPQQHALLARELFEAGLAALAAGTATTATTRRILGRPFTETALRSGLESTYRDIARTAKTARERNELVDRANLVRPRTFV
jgi:serine/threonine-protein kinase PknG